MIEINEGSYQHLTGKHILGLRKALGLSQQEFTDEFNNTEPKELRTTRSDVSHYEMGHVNIPAPKYIKFLSMSPRYRRMVEALNTELL